MLRTGQHRDVAPAEELDEYENEVVRTWQVAAYGMFSTFTLAVAFYGLPLRSSTRRPRPLDLQ